MTSQVALYYFGNSKADIVYTAPHGEYTFNNPSVTAPEEVAAPSVSRRVQNVHRLDVGFLKTRHNISPHDEGNPNPATGRTFVTFKTEDELTEEERTEFGIGTTPTAVPQLVPAEEKPARKRTSKKKGAEDGS